MSKSSLVRQLLEAMAAGRPCYECGKDAMWEFPIGEYLPSWCTKEVAVHAGYIAACDLHITSFLCVRHILTKESRHDEPRRPQGK